MTIKSEKINYFREAIEKTPDVKDGYCIGLNAIGEYKNRIKVKTPSKIAGSLDIDEITKRLYPNANRWDYAIGYDGKIYFVEVHSASGKEVKVVIAKLLWLKGWLDSRAPELNKLKGDRPYHWIQSGKFGILKDSRHYRIAAQNGILPKPYIELQ